MEDLRPDPEGKAGSRKYRLALVSLSIICIGVIAGAFVPGIAPLLEELISGVLGIIALYYTGNVANKYVVGKQAVKIIKKEEDQHGME